LTLNNNVFRTLVTSLILLLTFAAFISNEAQAREIRIFPVPAPAAPCVVAVFTACDLVRAAAGFAPTTGPDAGVTPQPGDTLVLAPGTYTLTALVAFAAGPPVLGGPFDGSGPVIVPGIAIGTIVGFPGGTSAMENLEIRSRDGAQVTVITTAPAGGLAATESCVILAADNVRFGGDQDDQGLTVQGCPRNGIIVGNPIISVNYGFGAAAPLLNVTGGGGADEDVVIQHNFIQNNGNATIANGVLYAFGGAAGPRAIENFRFDNNELRRNGIQPSVPPAGAVQGGNGLYFDPTVSAIGGSSEDEGVFITRNIFDSNAHNGVAFANAGDQEQVIFQQNYIVRNGDNGVLWAPTVTQLEDILFEGNIIQQNGFAENATNALPVRVEPATFGAGVAFANNGQIENTFFIGNHDDEFEEGITGNAGSGVVFAHAIAFPDGFGFDLPTAAAAVPGGVEFPGVGVQDIDTLDFSDNVINENGNGTVTLIDSEAGTGGLCVGLCAAVGPPAGAGTSEVPFDGVTFLNSGDLDPVTFSYNNVRLNAGAGVTIGLPGHAAAILPVAPAPGVGVFLAQPAFAGFAHPGDYDGNIVEGNVFWNNGTGGNGLNAGAGGVFFPHGDGFAVFSANDINDAVFRDNEAKENANNGVFLSSSGNDVTGARFFNNQFNKNGLQATVAGLLAGGGVPTADGLEISTFGDINDFIWDGGEAQDNGGNGVNLDANNNTLASAAYGALAVPPAILAAPFPVDPSAVGLVNLSDIDDVLITNGLFDQNGASAPIGAGNGIIATADKVSKVDINTVQGNRNDDHGVLLSSTDDMSDVSIKDSTFDNNDRNRDSVGSGVFFDSTDDMDNAGAENVMSNGNHVGFRFDVKGENGRNLYVRTSTANNNDEEGILVDGSDDLSDIVIDGNSLSDNNIGITLRSTDRGDTLLVTNNDVDGDEGTGIGIQLQAIGVEVTGNSVRDNLVGIKAERAEDSNINGNNIARNEDFGIDALGLKPGEILDATNNWWGEPSGPDADGNPNGLGDNLSDKIAFEPWLGEPAVETDVNFQIIEFNVGETANVGEVFLINATIRNNGTEEGSQTVNVKVDCGDFVDSNTVTRTLNPATEVEVDFNVVFPRGGECTVTVDSGNDSQSATVTVIGSTGVTIESVCDANDNNRIDDDEILTCIGFWVTGDEVPGTGQSISDAKILFLVELWVTNGDISTLPASAAVKTANWVESVINFFAPAATVNQSAVTEVAAGESFTVTATINANDSIQGLLFNEQLPEGWSISEVTTAGGFFKPSESKWLWVSAGNKTVTFTVNVPANTAEGNYSLSANLNANGFSTSSALNVRVSNPEILSVDNVAFNGSSFVAMGSGVTSVEVQVYNLGGGLVFDGQSVGNALSFNGLSNNGQILANGVYLYVSTVNGTNNQMVRTEVGKIMILN